MQKGIFTVCCFLIMAACQAQEQQEKAEARHVGGPCEGCEAIHEWGDRQLTAVDTLPDFGTPGPALKISGTVYQQDGKTPAPDVLLYIYHTNQQGIYPTRGDEKGWGRRHGYLRGWVKTGAEGRYTLLYAKAGTLSWPYRSGAHSSYCKGARYK